MKRIVVGVVTIALGAGAFVVGRVSADDDDGKRPPTTALVSGVVDETSTTAAMDHSAMDHEAMADEAVDDRGFAALANGEEHGPTFQQPISKTDRVELARQLALTREVALQYPTVADAEAAGLHRAGPFSPGLGAHYISYGNALGNSDGVMNDEDIRQPLAWIYDGTHQDSRIVGLFYMTGMENAEGFAGPNDTWHVHHDVCIKPGADGVIDAPLGADHDATPEQCDAVGGNLLQQTQYLLHVWTVPAFESPEGVYSHLSSSIACDDGTYNVIDVMKIGAKTTICVDGTE